ncbi:MAG: nitrilase-related carbon-nitrogen hydrolase [Verrucomicrobiota bacterium]
MLLSFLLTFACAIAQEIAPPSAITSPGAPPLAEYPHPDTVLDAMKRATSYFRTHVAYAGGYGWRTARDLSESQVEGYSAQAVMGLQPPGTPTVGLAYVEAYRKTGDPMFLQAANEAAQALIWCQMATGGWRSDFDFDRRRARRLHFRRDLMAGDLDPGDRRFTSSLDDNKSQSAILFLLELAHASDQRENTPLGEALDFALQQLLAAQTPIGAWGQHYGKPVGPDSPVVAASFPETWERDFPAVDYTSYYTLNDHNLLNVMRLLIRAHELEEDEVYLDAARRLGDFLLLAQLPEPQRTWAQQYNFDMHPAWARKFEPPSACSLESLSAIESLIEIWLATGDEKYIATIPEAFEWFERSQIEDDVWARFYELETSKPLYCKAETYEVTYDDSDLPTHYGFKVSGLKDDIADFRKMIETPRQQLLNKRAEKPESPKNWTSRSRSLSGSARQAILSQTRNEGIWIRDDMIDSALFARNLTRMAHYYEAAIKGGDLFRERHEKSEAVRPIRIAGIVLKWVRGDKEANWDRAKVMIREAAANGADIVVTTECFLDGYAIADKSIPLEKYRKLGEQVPDGKYVKRLRELADELDIHLVAGLLEAAGEHRFNCALMIDPEGQIAKYHKQHLGHESERNEPGVESRVFQTPVGDFGVMICADRRFPEIVNPFIEGGAEFLLCPSGGMFGPETNDPILQARSKETGRHIVFVHPAEFLVTAPPGEIVARTILGDQLLVSPEEIDTDADSRDIFYFDLPRR